MDIIILKIIIAALVMSVLAVETVKKMTYASSKGEIVFSGAILFCLFIITIYLPSILW